jgi:Skp family chaperone for outer membrane proteins
LKQFFIDKWKYIVAFAAGVLYIFISVFNKRKAQEFYLNRKNSDEAILEAERSARKAEAKKVDKINKQHDESLKKIKEDFKEKRKDVQLEKQSHEKDLDGDSLSKAIADLTGAEHVEKK